MALTKETVVDKIEVLENGTLQVRKAIRVIEDNEILSSKYQRKVLNPGDDITNEDERVSAIATTVWTPNVVTAYNDMIAAQETI
jgi:hypothetical protein